MSLGNVFFSHCQPQGSDPITLVVKNRRVFIGYPTWRNNIPEDPDPRQLRKWLIDLRCSEEEWQRLKPGFGKDLKQYQRIRNLALKIERRDIALVPRPDRGVVYAARVLRPFELINNPKWADEYLRIRQIQGAPDDHKAKLVAEIAQCWEVDDFRALPLPVIPAWLRRSMLGRSSYGRIKPLPQFDLEPFAVLNALLDNPKCASLPWTNDRAEVERRLLDGVGPNTFEHLCVALLQLEHPEQVWTRVAGGGDGGVNGIGIDQHGKVVGLLQCKWTFSGEQIFADLSQGRGLVRKQIVAALLHPENLKADPDQKFWPRSRIAELIIKHAEKLPLAHSLQVKAEAEAADSVPSIENRASFLFRKARKQRMAELRS